MNNIYFSDDAQHDMLEIKTYITEELGNPSSAGADFAPGGHSFFSSTAFQWGQVSPASRDLFRG